MRLDQAIERLSRQSGVAIGGIEPSAAAVRTRAVRGQMSVERALRRMLHGTDFDVVAVNAGTYRIVRRARLRPRRSMLPPKSRGAETPEEAIIVTGTKRETRLDDYAGSATVIDLDATSGDLNQTGGLEALLGGLPVTSSTNLGPGRNKLFIRGVADSSFNGPSQSTVGLYLGDVRLIYSAPNPDLRLYDVERVEILEGPQGTLYGVGALGGVVRIVPNVPVLGDVQSRAWAGLATTAGGGESYDLAGMVNVPVSGWAALRVLGYRQTDGGYIDDVGRGLRDVNTARIEGWRAALRGEIGGWVVDLGTATQVIETDDSQYAERDRPPLTRASALAQPYDLDFELFSATVTKDWGPLELVSATGLVRNDIDTRFDATSLSPDAIPTAFDESRNIDLFSHETRLARGGESGPQWVVGLGYLTSIDRQVRRLGPVGDTREIATARNEATEIALFGEAKVAISARLTGSIGGRLVHTHMLGERLTELGPEVEPSRDDLRFLPTAGLLWRTSDRTNLHVRYQRGFRAGGIGIGDGSSPRIDRFRPDTIETLETGFRVRGDRRNRLSGSATAFVTRWRDIQADLVDERGFPRTTNIGAGRVLGAAARVDWRPIDGFGLDASLFVNQSALTGPAPGLTLDDDRRLPNIAGVGARAGVSFETELAPGLRLAARSRLSYVGESPLGVGPALDFDQGEFVELNAGLSVAARGWSISVDAANLLDRRANRFSLGNPFSVAEGNQITPLRPRTVRVGVSVGF